MAIYRTCERAMKTARLFVISCCALAVASGAAFAQSNASSANFRDARLMSVLADGEPDAQTSSAATKVAIPFAANPNPIRASQIAAEQRSSENKIRQVRANVPAAKPKPIRQTQYSQSSQAAPYAQGLVSLNLDEKYDDSCPDLSKMPSIMDIPYKIVPTPGEFPENCPLPDEEFHRKAPTPITFTWKASSLCYKPLYFEDVQLERYGHYCHPLLQPICSRVRFWLTIPCLPYLMGVNPPNECIYDLGYYRPGNCAPSMIEPIPISLRGGLMEAGAVAGACALFP